MRMGHVQTRADLFGEEKGYIKGKLIHEIFHNPENLYSVCKIRVLESKEDQFSEQDVTIVGTFPPLHEGEVYTFWGELKEHPRFGLQYRVHQFRKELPQGKDGLIQYLSSDLFPGIGKRTAERIVDKLGLQAIPLILENPEVLTEIPRLTEQVRNNLYERLMEYQGLEQIMVKLSEYGIGLSLSVQIYQTYRERSMEVLQENPYQLIHDVEGIGFKRADIIGQAMGIASDSPERIRAAAIYFLREQSERNGHVYYPVEDCLHEVQEWLNDQGEQHIEKVMIEQDMIAHQITELAEEGKLILEEDRLYLPSLFFAERGFAKKVKQLLATPIERELTHQEFYEALGELEERLGIEYAPSQKEAIECALNSGLMILTGGPGTGKTTVIKGLCEIFAQVHQLSLDPNHYREKDESFPILLVAPTGRAAKRMAEATGLPAVTIHRLLGWKGGRAFDHSEDTPLSGRLLIVDESSMVDQWLANQLFRALPEGIQVVLVGDQDQLPSVGPGQVLKDLLESERIPIVELKEIYRQAEGSSIITLAHQMKRGEIPQDLSDAKEDRRFFPCRAHDVVKVVKQVYASALRRGYTTRDIQVLAPMYKGEAGIDALNKALQEEVNPQQKGKRQLAFGEQIFRVGDKVLQLVNSPENQVFNGDLGEIVAIIFARENVDQDDQLVVAFEQTEVTYKRKDLNQLTLAYCCSVHKSQGSEFPIVIIPVVRQYYRMLRRNLLYTAVTRGKEYLILCGEEEALERAIKQSDTLTRYTSLRTCLQEWIPSYDLQPKEQD